MSGPYGFRTVTRADLAMLWHWLDSPEARRWWGEPAEQYALIAEDIDNPLMTQWLVTHDGLPFAYVQAYLAAAWPQAHLTCLPPGSMVLDTFIGVPEMVGRGHGGRFLKLIAETLLRQGASLIAIDPAIGNERACRAYARAGFRALGPVETDAGPALLMVFEPGTGDHSRMKSSTALA